MYPPPQGLNLDIEAISGICGSISIACWVVVFSPQIVENFRRGSADGLSLQFIIVWLAGDIFNILGAVLQGVLPTMIILAVYYTLADVVLLGQCFYYRGFTWKDEVILPVKPIPAEQPTERTHLLYPNGNDVLQQGERRLSNWSNIDATHLSPVTPLIDARKPSDPPAVENLRPTTKLQAVLFNSIAVIMVCAAGVLGWWVSSRSQGGRHHGQQDLLPDDEDQFLQLNLWGQIFGYLCAVLYLGSRIPQILLNYRRKSTEGVSMLFFLFACIGNLTYVLSILAFEGACYGPQGEYECERGEAARLYARYMLVNASWLAGSLGTLFLDIGIFVQFFLYRPRDEDDADNADVDDWNQRANRPIDDDRPLLQRDDSVY